MLGVSVDSVHSHTHFAASTGGISFPLLADFHPKGAVAASFGLYLEDRGIADRATVVIDAGGTVRHVSSVSPKGRRVISRLAARCEEVDSAWSGPRPPWPLPAPIREATLFVKDACTSSATALATRTNLHLQEVLPVANVSRSPGARDRLEVVPGHHPAPCLVVDGQAIYQPEELMRWLAERAAPLD